MKFQYYANKESWEQTRMISYIVAQSNSTKKLNMTDILSFPWENEHEEIERYTEMSNSDLERLKQKAKNYLKAKS